MATWALALLLLAVPPLSDAQRDTLLAAIDDSPQLDGAAIYPLLENALGWAPQDEAGARVPDYEALLAQPTGARGELFLIEGRFAGRARRYGLARSGAWGEALTEWVLVVRDDPEEVAVVYFVDPEGTLASPATGAEVRVVGRFYKVWADRDQDGNPARYLTFVARSPTVLGPYTPAPGLPMLPMLLLIAVLGVAYLLIRRMGRRMEHEPVSRRSMPRPRDDAILSDPAPPEPPESPESTAEALQRMADEHDKP